MSQSVQLLRAITKKIQKISGLLFVGLFVFQITVAPVLAQSVIINEFMADPGSVVVDADGEWVELVNTTANDIDLTSWTIDGATIPAGTVIPANGAIVLCRNSDVTANGSVKCSGQVSIELTNSGETLVLQDDGGTTIDSVEYEGTDVNTGQSTNVERDANDNVTGFNSEDTATYGATEGTDDQNGTPAENKITNSNKANHSYGDVNHAVDDASSGDTVNVGEGTYNVREQVNIDEDIDLKGAGKDETTLTKDFNTGSSGNSRGWFLVQAGNEFNISDLALDGSGSLTWQALRVLGSGSADNVHFSEIQYNPSTSYQGTAIAAFGDGTFDVTNSEFSEIGRIGTQYFGAGVDGSTYDNNVYTGKGEGDWLDYGVEVGGGAPNIQITNSIITNNLGTASSDGSASAGILATTYFAPGTSAIVNSNKITGNSYGLFVGFDSTDTSVVTASNNSFANNGEAAIVNVSTVNTVTATNNWFGDESGPKDTDNTDGSTPASNDGTGCAVIGQVSYGSWLDSNPFGDDTYENCDEEIVNNGGSGNGDSNSGSGNGDSSGGFTNQTTTSGIIYNNFSSFGAINAGELVAGNAANLDTDGDGTPDAEDDTPGGEEESDDDSDRVASDEDDSDFDYRWLLLVAAILAFLWFLLKKRQDDEE